MQSDPLRGKEALVHPEEFSRNCVTEGPIGAPFHVGTAFENGSLPAGGPEKAGNSKRRSTGRYQQDD